MENYIEGRVVLGVLCLILFIVSILTSINYSFLFMGFFLCVNGILNDNSIYFDRVKTYNKYHKSLLEIKTYKIDTFDKVKMLKCISPHYYTIFEYYDGKKVVKITEDELLDLNDYN